MVEAPTSVGLDFPRQVDRVRALVAEYDALPNGAGAIAAFVMRGQLAQAVADWATGDVVAILRSYEALRSWE